MPGATYELLLTAPLTHAFWTILCSRYARSVLCDMSCIANDNHSKKNHSDHIST